MAKWHDFFQREGTAPPWPYALDYEKEYEIDTDILVIGGGIAGCWAAISATRKGARVALVEKGDTIRSGSGGPGCDHWCQCPANPHSKVAPDEWAKVLAQHPGTMSELPKGTPRWSYGNGIGTQITCRENYDTLLELEQMGGQIRDIHDEYVARGLQAIPFPLCDWRRISHGLESRRRACFDGADNTADAGHGVQAQLVWRRRRCQL